ncbi:MAG: hypothetical protein LPD71_11435 [Shewanella sp.]|nr:hypothetical protein [Shewanella sp.]
MNTERGRNELAKGGNQDITTIELPLTDTNIATGLIEPGMLVEVQDTLLGESGNWRGLCLATSIRASGVGTVIQSKIWDTHKFIWYETTYLEASRLLKTMGVFFLILN